MTYAQTLKKGTSLCFTHELTREALLTVKHAGIDAVELSFNRKYYMETIDFPHNAREYGALAKEIGVELWSIHLPFSRQLDISNLCDEDCTLTMETNLALIRAAGEIGIRVAVLHPSSEPISDEIRPERLRRSKENIIRLREACDAAGMLLAVENLPRTCLCNRSDEMISLLEGTGAGIVFDTNHALGEDNLHFLTALKDSGLPIYSLHISDYDFVDERHRLPGDGINRWQELLSILEAAGYSGPLMYEVPAQPKDRDVIPVSDLASNMTALAAGWIH